MTICVAHADRAGHASGPKHADNAPKRELPRWATPKTRPNVGPKRDKKAMKSHTSVDPMYPHYCPLSPTPGGEVLTPDLLTHDLLMLDI